MESTGAAETCAEEAVPGEALLADTAVGAHGVPALCVVVALVGVGGAFIQVCSV